MKATDKRVAKFMERRFRMEIFTSSGFRLQMVNCDSFEKALKRYNRMAELKNFPGLEAGDFECNTICFAGFTAEVGSLIVKMHLLTDC